MGKAQNSGLAHCCHHDKHWGFCFDFEERVRYIKTEKPEDEQALRLRLFQIIPDDQLPGRESPEWDASEKARDTSEKARDTYLKARDTYLKAAVAYLKARYAYEKARDASYMARDAADKAWDAYIAKYKPELDLLHDRLFLNCPFDGETIFEGGKVKNG